jgi:hypothetical protein
MSFLMCVDLDCDEFDCRGSESPIKHCGPFLNSAVGLEVQLISVEFVMGNSRHLRTMMSVRYCRSITGPPLSADSRAGQGTNTSGNSSESFVPINISVHRWKCCSSIPFCISQPDRAHKNANIRTWSLKAFRNFQDVRRQFA